MNKLKFNDERFPSYEQTGEIIKNIRIGEMIHLLDDVIQGMTVADAIELTDYKGFFENQIPRGEVYTKENVEKGEELLNTLLLDFICKCAPEKIEKKENEETVVDIVKFKLLLQSLLQSSEVVIPHKDQDKELCNRELARVTHIYTLLFKGQEHRMVPVLNRFLASLTLTNLIQVGTVKNIIKMPEGLFGNVQLLRIGTNGDQISLISLIEKIRQKFFPDTDIINLQMGGPKEKWDNLEYPLFDLLRSELTQRNIISDLLVAGFFFEKISAGDFVDLTKKIFSEISLYSLTKYSYKDIFPYVPGGSSIEPEEDGTKFYKKGLELQSQGIFNTVEGLPKNYPEYLKLKFALWNLDISIEDLQPTKKSEHEDDRSIIETIGKIFDTHIDLFKTEVPVICDFLRSITLLDIFNMAAEQGYLLMKFDKDFTEEKKRELTRLGLLIQDLKLMDTFSLLKSEGKLQSEDLLSAAVSNLTRGKP